MRRTRRAARVVSAALAICLLLTGCSYRDVSRSVKLWSARKLAGNVEMREGTPFEELSYTRFDAEAAEAEIERIRGLMTDAGNSGEVLEAFDALVESEDDLYFSYEYASIRSDMDVTDDYWADELEYATETMYTVDDEICILGGDILESACEKAARKSWYEEEIEYYEEYEALPEGAAELMAQETALESDYYEAAAGEFTVKYGGKVYDMNALYTADLTQGELLEVYNLLTAKMGSVLGPIYLDMLEVRAEIAKAFGYDSYAEYSYEMEYCRDYTPEESALLSETVREEMLDLFFYVYGNSNDSSGLDMCVASADGEEQLEMIAAQLDCIDSEMNTSMEFMRKHGLYDIEYRPGKYDGGFTTFLTGYGEPFLFLQPGGIFYDLTSLVHEFGHYNSYYVNAETADSYSNIDISEICSQGLELLFTFRYGTMLGEEFAETARDYVLTQVLASVCDGCMYDEFQQKVYAMESPALEEINRAFAETAEPYGYTWDDPAEAWDWILVPHNFIAPFYYISYAVSALPALEIWTEACNDFDAACTAYTLLVYCGEGGSYRDTLTYCGLNCPFDGNTVEKLAKDMFSRLY